jgi:sugar phosphate isomerase/epimerase
MTTPAVLTRREFIGTAAALPLAAPVLSAFRQTKPVGLELYSVRHELTKDLPGTVTAVAKLGYQVVEFYSPYFEWTTERAKEVRKLLDDLGIKCPSTHNGGQSLTGDGLKKAIELNRIIGSQYIVLASPGRVSGPDHWKALAERLTAAADELRPHGMAAGFHNHQTEWKPVDGTNGQRPMDVLAAGTPKDVVLQLDVGTCLEAGADPVAWINANPGRIKSIHCKDWSKARRYDVAFGEGEAPWKGIIEAAERTGGVEYYLIEQETAPEGQAIDMARRCLENWKQLRA